MAEPLRVPAFEEWREEHKRSSQNSRRSKRTQNNVYNPVFEALPDERFFKLDRQGIDQAFSQIAESLLGVLTGARPEDKQLAALQLLARSLQKVVIPETLDVAMVGQQGMGKSAAINALQHRPKLSTTSALGGACTATAIRFCLKEDAADHSELFDAKIRFMNDEELTENIQEHIHRYHHFHFGSVDKNDETYYEDKRAAEEAENFFRVLHNVENDKEAATRLEFLLTAKSIKKKHLLIATMEYAHLRIRNSHLLSSPNEERTIVFKDQTIGALMEQVESYMARHESMHPPLWGIVQSVEILLNSRLTKHGVCIRDLPGLNDISQFRNAISYAYRRKAGYEMIFARTDRVTTEDTVHKHIRQSIKAHGAKGTILVLTRIDEYLLDDDSVHEVIKTDTRHPFPEVRRMLEENEQAMTALAALLEENGDPNADEEYEERRAFETALVNMAKLEFIPLRAQDVEEKIQAIFKDVDPEPIQVFSISAQMYLGWMKRGHYDRPIMSPEQTGVPALRQYLLQLCAEANLAVYKAHAFEKMDSLLDKCRRITEVEKKDNSNSFDLLRSTLAHETGQVKIGLARVFDDFLKNDRGEIFEDEKRKAELQVQLMDVVTGWGYGSQWNTYRACLLRKGIGFSGAAKYRNSANPSGAYNWNEEQSVVTEQDMNAWQGRMGKAVGPLADQLEDVILKGCRNIKEYIMASSLCPELRNTAVREWSDCEQKVLELSDIEPNLHRAIKETHQYATTETDIRCMNAKLNADFYNRVHDIDSFEPTIFTSRYAAQKGMMKEVMSGPDHKGRNLIDRIEHAVKQQSKKDLRAAFNVFVEEVVQAMGAFDEYISDRAPLDYELTETDRRLRQDILNMIPELVAMILAVRAKFNDDALLTPQVLRFTRLKDDGVGRGEPATKKMKVDRND